MVNKVLGPARRVRAAGGVGPETVAERRAEALSVGGLHAGRAPLRGARARGATRQPSERGRDAAGRIRAERLENHWIESCSDSEDGDAHFLARERQRQSRCGGGRRAARGGAFFLKKLLILDPRKERSLAEIIAKYDTARSAKHAAYTQTY
mgnify:CR=1 FL=1